MFNQAAKTNWFPYTIPPTPSEPAPKPSKYALGLSGLNSETNPSQFLQWQPFGGLPDGAKSAEFAVCENGDPKFYWFIYWEKDPLAEEVQ